MCIFPTMYGKMQGEEKQNFLKTLVNDKMPMYLSALENIMKLNGSTGFFVGKEMTIADIAMWRLFGWLTSEVLDQFPKDLLENYPLLLMNFKWVDSHPQIRQWMDSHYPNLKQYDENHK